MINRVHLAALLVLLSAGTLEAASVYTIKPRAEAVSALVQAGEAQGAAATAQAGQAEGLPSLLTASFSSGAEAWVAMKSLPPDQASGLEIVAAESPSSAPVTSISGLVAVKPFRSVPPPAFEKLTDSLKRLGAAPTGEVAQALKDKPTAQLSRSELLAVGTNAANAEGVPALERFLAENPEAPEANSARLRLARRLMGRKDYAKVGETLAAIQGPPGSEEREVANYLSAYNRLYKDGNKAALPEFLAVANSETAPSAIRHDAMRVVAAAYHSDKDYRNSWLAFEDIAEASGDPEMVGDAKVELAGLAFELCLNGKGTWDEVRGFCNRVLEAESFPAAKKATAALMRAETYYYEGNLDEAILQMDSVTSTYSANKREASMAALWKGIFLTQQKKYSQAEEVLTAVGQMELKDAEKFAKKDPKAIALTWLTHIAEQQGDAPKAQAYATMLIQDFPNSTEAKRAASISRKAVLARAQQAPPEESSPAVAPLP
jgi:tetratricopeptide (TPR) repeat protein